MKLKLLTIPFNPHTRKFEDELFESFQEDKEIRQFHPRFFNVGEEMYLGVLVAYDEKHLFKQKNRPAVQKKNLNDLLDEREKQLFEEMKKLRKEKSDVLGLPPYVLGTDSQVIQVIQKRCKTVQALKNIHGFGDKKVDSIGRDFIELVKLFYPEHEQV